MTITPAMIKELRARTGAGMMDCKAALNDAGGDLDAAAQELRKKGVASADKKAGRIAAEGVIAVAGDGRAAALVEINCETDFVAKDESFREYAGAVARALLTAAPADLESAAEVALGDGDSNSDTVDAARRELVARIGENISLRRFTVVNAGDGDGNSDVVGTYLHGTRIGVLVRMRGGDESLARDIAMHIAASRPLCIGESDMPADELERERAIFMAQAADSGKPEEIAKKMVDGRMKKFLKENTLLGQPFVKDPEQTVMQLTEAAGATVTEMVRLEVGEGLEKRADDFVAEVRAQAGR